MLIPGCRKVSEAIDPPPPGPILDRNAQLLYLAILDRSRKICETPGAIYKSEDYPFLREYLGVYNCLDQPVASGMIYNYDTQELITSSSIRYSDQTRISCKCNGNNYREEGAWYHSTSNTPVNGQEAVLITKDGFLPFSSYEKGGVYYCVPGKCTDMKRFQKIVIE